MPTGRAPTPPSVERPRRIPHSPACCGGRRMCAQLSPALPDLRYHAPKRLHLKRPAKVCGATPGQTPTFHRRGRCGSGSAASCSCPTGAYCTFRRAFKEACVQKAKVAPVRRVVSAFTGPRGPPITGGIGEAERSSPLPAALINEQAPTIAKSIPLHRRLRLGIGSLRAQGGALCKRRAFIGPAREGGCPSKVEGSYWRARARTISITGLSRQCTSARGAEMGFAHSKQLWRVDSGPTGKALAHASFPSRYRRFAQKRLQPSDQNSTPGAHSR